MNLDPKIRRAVDFAAEAHAGQVRKYTGIPYVIHPIRVAMTLMRKSIGFQAAVIAALLHDVVEDTHVTLHQIEQEFGRNVSDLVAFLTNAEHPEGLNRAARKKLDRERLAGVPRIVKKIKILDRIDNLQEMNGAPPDFVRLYCEESRLLLEESLRGVELEMEQELLAEIARLEATLTPTETFENPKAGC